MNFKINSAMIKKIQQPKPAVEKNLQVTTAANPYDQSEAFSDNLLKDLNPLFNGGPARNRFANIRQTEGPNKGLLKDQFNLQMDMAPMNQLRAQTLNDGPSPYVQMQMGQQDLKNQTAMQEARKAQPNPLMNGKVNAELGAMKMMNPANMVNPQLQANQANLNIALQGRQQQMDRLRAMPGLENQVLKPQEFNINNALNEKTAEDMAKMGGWNEDMKAWAATQQARAQAKAGSSKK